MVLVFITIPIPVGASVSGSVLVGAFIHIAVGDPEDIIEDIAEAITTGTEEDIIRPTEGDMLQVTGILTATFIVTDRMG